MKRLYHYPAMFVLSVFAVLVLIVFEITAYASQIMFKDEIYSETLGRYDVATSIYDSLDTYFEQYAAPTGIPKEVFTDTLDKDELCDSAYQLISDSVAYLTDENASAPEVKYDFTALEESVTDYVESYSDENGIEKDDDYYSLIDNTITTAEEQIESRLDVLMLYTLSQKSFASKLHTHAKTVTQIMFASAAVLLILLAIMCIVNRHHPRDMTYWFGCIIVASSVIFLVPATYLDKINYFDSFFMRTEHIYLMITGLFQTMLDDIIETQTILLIIGVALILLTIVIHSIYLKYREARHRHNELTD